MKIREIPLEEWFIFKPEALEYLNKVASEIHALAFPDTSVRRTILQCLSHYVTHIEGYAADEFRFQLEMDRGRPFKGHYYGVCWLKPDANVHDLPLKLRCSYLYRKYGLSLYRLGSPNRVIMDVQIQDVMGHHLVAAIGEIIAQDVYAD